MKMRAVLPLAVAIVGSLANAWAQEVELSIDNAVAQCLTHQT